MTQNLQGSKRRTKLLDMDVYGKGDMTAQSGPEPPEASASYAERGRERLPCGGVRSERGETLSFCFK